MTDSKNQQIRLLACLTLCLITLAVYWPVLAFPFVNYDDPAYVYTNPHVLGGVSGANLSWAFRSTEMANWHPITWLSHLLDVQLFGLNAGRHHAMSLMLHMVNTVLLFVVFFEMTGAMVRSWLVAVLFAAHPMHVESVVWISERKDILSTLFALLALRSYVRHAKRPSPGSIGLGWDADYLLSLGWFALALMTKAMVVTLPFLTLLLDYWPLGRGRIPGLVKPNLSTPEAQTCGLVDGRGVAWSRLLVEKIPFLALAAAVAILASAMLKAGEAIHQLGDLSLGNRAANSAISCVRYLGKLFWPADMVVFYPRPLAWPLMQSLLAAGLVVALSIAALLLARKKPFVPVGWFWFIGTLAPVIGLVHQLGAHAIADRYTYLPYVGLFIILSWGFGALSATGPLAQTITVCGVVGAVAGLAILAHRQAMYWRSSDTLFRHALAVDNHNAMAHSNLGASLVAAGDWPSAQAHFEQALALQPNWQPTRANLAIALAHQGQFGNAESALAGLNSRWEAITRHKLAGLLRDGLRPNEAIEQESLAARADPDNAAIRQDLGQMLAEAGRTAQARSQFEAVVRLAPDAEAYYHLALCAVILADPKAAITNYQAASRLRPNWVEPLNDLAWLRATHPEAGVRDGADAVRLAEQALALGGRGEPRLWGTLDASYAEAGRFPEAITAANEAERLALSVGDESLAADAARRRELYQQSIPFHQKPLAKEP